MDVGMGFLCHTHFLLDIEVDLNFSLLILLMLLLLIINQWFYTRLTWTNEIIQISQAQCI